MRERKRHSVNEAQSETPPAPEAQGDGEPSAADVQDRGEVSEADVDSSQQLAEQRDKYLRLAAEFDNYRRRTMKERLEAGARGQAELVARMLEAVDDLGRFAHIDPSTTDAMTLHKGIEMIEQKLLKLLGGMGLEVINPVDQSFDPNLHEAISTEPALSREDDHTVSKVFQPGYRFNGQLLRPARVVVKQWNG